MALVVFLRGVNAGGGNRFRPSLLAKELRDYDVVNIGAAGTFVVRNPGSRAKFESALRAKLPFETDIVVCEGRDVLQLERENPFETVTRDVVPFVSILPRRSRARVSLPIVFPPDGGWLVRVLAARNRFIFGLYRRHMKTIGYLGQLDKLFGMRATTRNWTTIRSIVEILKRRSDE